MIVFPYKMCYIKYEKDNAGFDGVYIINFNGEDDADDMIAFVLTTQSDLYKIPYFSLIFKKGQTVKDAIDSYPHDDFFKSLIETNIKLYINTLLYISLPTADIKKQLPTDIPAGLTQQLKKANTKRKKDVAMQNIRQAGYSIINLVGQSFTKAHQTSDPTYTVATHWRRGHWRNQPYGDDQKKLIWIQPVVVNAHKNEAPKGHIYKTA